MDATEPTAETASPPATTGAPDTLHAAVGEFYRHWSPRRLSGIAGGFVALRIALGGWSLGDLALVAAIATSPTCRTLTGSDDRAWANAT